MRTFLRGVLTFSSIGVFLVRGSLTQARTQRLRLVHRACAQFLYRMGFRIEVRGRVPDAIPALWVSNHLSFWDVLIYASIRPLHFLTSFEVRETPVLGGLTRIGGCLYTERRGSTQEARTREIAHFAQELKSAPAPLMLFAEGTSSNGEQVLPFKRRFFESAVQAGVPVCPVCIEYVGIDGEPVTSQNRDALFYYGDQAFWPQLQKVFRLRRIRVRVTFLETIAPTSGQSAADLCEQVQQSITSVYTPVGVSSQPMPTQALHTSA